LNAGQVGSFRAAQFIARRYGGPPPGTAEFLRTAETRIVAIREQAERMLDDGTRLRPLAGKALDEIRARMSACGAHIRDPRTIENANAAAWRLHRRLHRSLPVAGPEGLSGAFRVLDHALTQAVYLEAMREYLARGGRSRGSYLILDPNGEQPCPTLGRDWAFSLATPEDEVNRRILEIRLDAAGRPEKHWADIRPIPDADLWFENIWNDYRNNAVIR
jgi:hypothetical protein